MSVSGQVVSGRRRQFCCRVIKLKPLVRNGNLLYFFYHFQLHLQSPQADSKEKSPQTRLHVRRAHEAPVHGQSLSDLPRQAVSTRTDKMAWEKLSWTNTFI